MNLFDIDYPTLVKFLLPPFFRTPKMRAWCGALIAPVISLYQQFLSNRSDNLYRLNHTPQVFSIEAVLNDRFDAALRRIRIVDGPRIDSTYIYRRDEAKPRYIYRASESQHTYIRTTEETISSGPDFIVRVPAAVSFEMPLMRALVSDYCLATKTFEITIV